VRLYLKKNPSHKRADRVTPDVGPEFKSKHLKKRKRKRKFFERYTVC
jgi:hypothetical protein